MPKTNTIIRNKIKDHRKERLSESEPYRLSDVFKHKTKRLNEAFDKDTADSESPIFSINPAGLFFAEPKIDWLTFDQIDNAIKTIRGNSFCMDNCRDLAMSMMEYFRTRKLPQKLYPDYFLATDPTMELMPKKVSEAKRLDDFADPLLTKISEDKNALGVSIKQLDFAMVSPDDKDSEGVVQASHLTLTVSSSSFYSPSPECEKRPIVRPHLRKLEEEGRAKAYNVPGYYYSEVNHALMEAAKKNANREVFGLLSLVQSGDDYMDGDDDSIGHRIAYYATPDKVYFVDGHFLVDGIPVADKPGPVFENLADAYDFVDTVANGKESKHEYLIFSNKVFVDDYSHLRNEEELMPDPNSSLLNEMK